MSTATVVGEITGITVASFTGIGLFSAPIIWLGRRMGDFQRSQQENAARFDVQDTALAQILRILIPEGGPTLAAELVRVDTEQKATAKLVDRLLPSLGATVTVNSGANSGHVDPPAQSSA